MADPIDIQISVTGGDQAARSVDGVAESLDHERRAADGAAGATAATENSFQDLTRGGTQVIQRIQGATAAVQGLATAFGSDDRTAGLISHVAGTTAQFASMGAMLGPGGAVLGALIGFGTSLYSLAEAHDAAREAAEDQTDTIDDLAETYRGLGAVIMEWGDVLGVENAARAGGEALTGLTDADLEAQLRRRQERLLELRVADSESGALVRSEEDTRLREEVAGLEAEIARREDEAEERRNGRGSRGGASAETAPTDFYASINGESANEAADRINGELAANEDAYQEHADRIVEIEREKNDYLRELDEERLEAEREKQDYLVELAEQQREDQLAFDAEMAERAEAAAEEREQELNGLMQMVGKSSKMLFTAIAQVATGAKSGEEAFLGLLKSFLEMISEYASLKAATEFADAAASFARYDFGGGAAHVGAGLAFTAVAVATGVGAAAIGSGAPQQPAKPAAREDTGTSQGNVTNVINFNSPVVTAGTRAELGREIESLRSEADAA